MKELPRRLWHIGGGLSLPIAGLLVGQKIFLPALCSVTIAFLIFELVRLKVPWLNCCFLTRFRVLLREREASTLTASTYLLIAASIVFILCDTPIAAMALTFAAVGDPVAGMVGERWGKQKIIPEKLRFSRKPKSGLGASLLKLLRKVSNFAMVKGKSLEGSSACLAACLVAGAILAAITHIELWVVVLGAICATLVELISSNDNLTIPLVTGGLMSLLLWC